jgi:hypothetical protein
MQKSRCLSDMFMGCNVSVLLAQLIWNIRYSVSRPVPVTRLFHMSWSIAVKT